MRFSTPVLERDKTTLAWLILVLWFVLSGLAIWSTFHEPYRDFLESRTPQFGKNNRVAGIDRVTVIHFVDESCPCTRFSKTHIASLEDKFSTMRHVRIGANDALPDGYSVVKNWAVSSPAVAIIKAGGELAYYGPYTDGALCNQGEDLVEGVMQSLENNTNYQWFNVLGYGCFCDWPGYQGGTLLI